MTPSRISRFTIRVYGILITSGKVLLSYEQHKGMEILKFPGGGLKFGEGIGECLKREWLEETRTEVIGYHHFYTTDFFQRSAFDPAAQVISVYYRVKVRDIARLTARDCPQILPSLKDGQLLLYWHPLNESLTGKITFPIDKFVAGLLTKSETRGKN